MIYLDNAATSFPKPEAVYRAAERCMRTFAANPGRSGHKLALQAGREIYLTREAAAELFHVSDPFRMIFTANATESLNLALKGILQPGDHVITSSMEHNSVLRPLSALKEHGITVTIVPCTRQGSLEPEAVQAAIQSNTRLIAVTHASNVTGTIMPVKEIMGMARDRQILLLLDASQTAGILDIDLEECPVDLFAAPGHKGLLGPQGTGLLYIREGLALKPMKEGGTGSRSEELTQPELIPDRYESGTLNTPGIVGLGAGIQYVKFHRAQIQERETQLTRFFLEELKKVKDVILYGADDVSAPRIGVVSLNIGDLDSCEAACRLDQEFDICTRPGLHCAPLAHRTIGTLDRGTVRFSIGFETTEAEMIKTLDAIRQIALHS